MAICYDIHLWGITSYKYTKLAMMAKSEKKEKNSRKKRKSLPERIDLLPVEEDQKSFKIYSCKSMIAYKLSGS